MIYAITFTKKAEKVLKKWKKSNPQLFNKAKDVINELKEHPRTGTGHPEPLKGGDGITYSRHISAHDRILYDIHDDVVEVNVFSLEGHYDDK